MFELPGGEESPQTATYSSTPSPLFDSHTSYRSVVFRSYVHDISLETQRMQTYRIGAPPEKTWTRGRSVSVRCQSRVLLCPYRYRYSIGIHNQSLDWYWVTKNACKQCRKMHTNITQCTPARSRLWNLAAGTPKNGLYPQEVKCPGKLIWLAFLPSRAPTWSLCPQTQRKGRGLYGPERSHNIRVGKKHKTNPENVAYYDTLSENKAFISLSNINQSIYQSNMDFFLEWLKYLKHC